MMEFTGERYVPEIHGNIELEHLHRYLLASEIVTGKIVLDIACGEGYGSAMLATRANKVTGVDISSETIKHARERYKIENLDFIVGSCIDIPLPDASVDLVVSFETIEHLEQHDQMMKEIKRVLSPTGSLLISSPDKYYYSIETGYINPFHKKELYQLEFKQLLGNYYKNIIYFGQRVVYGSSILSELLPTSTLSYFQENETIKTAHGVIKPTYWIALASDMQSPDLSSGFFEQPINDSEVIQSWRGVVSERDQTIQSLTAKVAEYEQAVQALTSQLTERDQSMRLLNTQIAERDQTIQSLNTENVMYAMSKSWRVTRPLRKIVKILKGKRNA
jgi:ubiquinone/menaquinone biosynthesis C-methylase UbiE